jgi:hypothetical protein
LDDWEEFVKELEVNFGPYDETGEAENELAMLKMLTGQRSPNISSVLTP